MIQFGSGNMVPLANPFPDIPIGLPGEAGFPDDESTANWVNNAIAGSSDLAQSLEFTSLFSEFTSARGESMVLSEVSAEPGPSLPAQSVTPVSGPASPASSDCSAYKGANPAMPRHKRPSHKRAEIKRRDKIKGRLDDLRDEVPTLVDKPKLSETAILSKAAEYLAHLKGESERFQTDATNLRQEIESLSTDIQTLQQNLPETGLSQDVVEDKPDVMDERYEQYVAERTADNWKFYLFNFLAKPLFESFKQDVSTESTSTMCESLVKWSKDSKNLVSLRQVSSNAMRTICKETSILSKPEDLPREALASVRKTSSPSHTKWQAAARKAVTQAGRPASPPDVKFQVSAPSVSPSPNLSFTHQPNALFFQPPSQAVKPKQQSPPLKRFQKIDPDTFAPTSGMTNITIKKAQIVPASSIQAQTGSFQLPAGTAHNSTSSAQMFGSASSVQMPAATIQLQLPQSLVFSQNFVRPVPASSVQQCFGNSQAYVVAGSSIAGSSLMSVGSNLMSTGPSPITVDVSKLATGIQATTLTTGQQQRLFLSIPVTTSALPPTNEIAYQPIPTTSAAEISYQPMPTTSAAEIVYQPMATTTAPDISYQPIPATAAAEISYEPTSTTTPEISFQPIPTTSATQISYQPIPATSAPQISYQPIPTTSAAEISYQPTSTITTVNMTGHDYDIDLFDFPILPDVHDVHQLGAITPQPELTGNASPFTCLVTSMDTFPPNSSAPDFTTQPAPTTLAEALARQSPAFPTSSGSTGFQSSSDGSLGYAFPSTTKWS